MTRGIWLGLMALLVSVTSVLARDPGEPFAGRMSLGHHREAIRIEMPELAPPRSSGRRQCQRWKTLAARLGETYAGHRLREIVLQRVCGLSEERVSGAAWSWPWASLDRGESEPPRLHRTFGAWEIKCDPLDERRRCAVLARLQPSSAAAEAGGKRILVHFVIDMVAGQESVLWRLFVPHGSGAPEPARNELASVDGTPGQQREVLGAVSYRLVSTVHTEGFPACGARGCLMEGHLRRAGEVASRLWDGRSLDLDVRVGRAQPFAVTLPARGFRAAFNELVRLRREEMRSHGRR